MLTSLHIENIAVIKSVDIDFKSGFTALTGETGAGKSIIIDSINLLLGKKAERELIRNGEDTAMVSGLFCDLGDDSLERFCELGIHPDEDGNLLVQRTVTLDGKSNVRINGRAVTLSVLRSLGSYLINIHGQSDTHALTDTASHLGILDTFAEVDELYEKYKAAFEEYDAIKREIKNISDKEQERIRLTEILEYQIKDIDSLSLHDGEEEELIDKKLKIKNSERITKQSSFVFKALKGSEKGSVSYLLDRSIASLTSLSDVIPEFSVYAERLRDFLYQIDDISEEVYAAVDDIDDDPTEKLNQIESRLDKISKLKRKYGLTVSDVLAFRDRAFSELERLKNSEDLLKELSVRCDTAYNKALSLADELHNIRLSAAKELEKRVKETLEFLDMPKVVFFASIKESFDAGKKVLNKNGSDNVEFFISANAGLEPEPLSKIASGGELARIMLALKSVIADKDGVKTVVFDEIDAGVSGKTARKIGIKMLSLAKGTQLLCVTHSAQIASLADSHFLITKRQENDVTQTAVSELNEEGRIRELSRILGGIEVTDSQRAAAVDMLKEREIYK